MSKYIIEHTYSLQLAAACVKVTDKYYNDYEELRNKMDDVKAKMAGSKPLGALPIMKTEIRTGYPAIEESPDKNRVDISKETAIKLDEKNEKIKEFSGTAWNNQLGDLVVFTHEWAIDDEVKNKLENILMWGSNNEYVFSFLE